MTLKKCNQFRKEEHQKYIYIEYKLDVKNDYLDT